jgi:hypothetical protein
MPFITHILKSVDLIVSFGFKCKSRRYQVTATIFSCINVRFANYLEIYSSQLSQNVRRRPVSATLQSSRMWDVRPNAALRGYCWRRWYAELQEAILVADVPETLFIVIFPRFSRVPYYVPFLFVSVYLSRVSCSSRIAFRGSNIGEFAKKSVLVSSRYRIIRTMAAPGSDPFNRCSVALINYCGNNGRSRRQGHVFSSSRVRSPCIEIRKHCLLLGITDVTHTACRGHRTGSAIWAFGPLYACCNLIRWNAARKFNLCRVRDVATAVHPKP